MGWMTSNSLLMMQQSMRFLWTKTTAISDNIINAETPQYKTKFVTFEEELRAKLESAADGRRPAAAMREVLSEARATVQEATGESTRMDGNGVNLTEQSVEMGRTAYQLQYVQSAISTDMAILRSAIRGQ